MADFDKKQLCIYIYILFSSIFPRGKEKMTFLSTYEELNKKLFGELDCNKLMMKVVNKTFSDKELELFIKKGISKKCMIQYDGPYAWYVKPLHKASKNYYNSQSKQNIEKMNGTIKMLQKEQEDFWWFAEK